MADASPRPELAPESIRARFEKHLKEVTQPSFTGTLVFTVQTRQGAIYACDREVKETDRAGNARS